MMPPQVKGRPREGEHALWAEIRLMGPYVVVRLDDDLAPAFWVEVTVPAWRLAWLMVRGLWPFGDAGRIEAS